MLHAVFIDWADWMYWILWPCYEYVYLGVEGIPWP